ncbi:MULTISPECIES: MmyB family transcriptional regulator [unclassified Streptomyces]|uniref:MmyB family transcriptional regulator n=1 Tax=unclassified Streptomyces TaxID=2593676 RepID=UPI003D745CEA
MAYQAGGQRSVPRPVPESPGTQAYLRDYATLLEAVPHPSVVLNHRWDVVLANAAFETLFGEVGPHPTAMPGDNLLRFVLFHPDAAGVLVDHEAGWCLPALALLAAASERHGHDHGLQAIRRDIAQDPIMEAAYRQGLPHWLRAVGAQAAEYDGAVRRLAHPDPRRGVTEYRIVCEVPKALADEGYVRLTMVPREARPAPPPRRTRRPRRTAGHLSVVPAAPEA